MLSNIVYACNQWSSLASLGSLAPHDLYLHRVALTVKIFLIVCCSCLIWQSEETPIDDLMELVQQILAFHMKVQYISFILLKKLYCVEYRRN